MEHGLSNALSIMVVGMVTVFFILWLVVIIGNILIRITNKYWPALEVPKNGTQQTNSSNGTIAAIIAAVDSVTNGKGKVTKITKE